MAKRGRKGKFTIELVNTIVALLEGGNSDGDTCALVGISQETFYAWARTKPDFAEAVGHARSKARRAAVAAWRQGMLPTTTVADATETFSETRINARTGEPYTYTRTKVTKTVTNHPADWRAAAEYLKRRDPFNWSEVVRNVNLNRDVSQMTDEELERLARGEVV